METRLDVEYFKTKKKAIQTRNSKLPSQKTLKRSIAIINIETKKLNLHAKHSINCQMSQLNDASLADANHTQSLYYMTCRL